MTPPGAAPPLDGMRVLVPRPAERAAALIGMLRAAGAIPVATALIATTPDMGSPAAVAAANDLAAGVFDWVAFTSTAAVDAIAAHRHDPGVALLGTDSAHDAPRGQGLVAPATRVAAVGHGTAAALVAAGCRVDLVPASEHSGGGLAAAWPAEPPGRSVLLPRSDRARPELENALRSSGHRVYPAVVYRTELLPLPDPIVRELETGAIGGVLLTSPSSCEALSNALAGMPLAPTVTTIAIGPTTATAARRAGFTIAAIAQEASDAGLANALVHAVAVRTRTRQ